MSVFTKNKSMEKTSVKQDYVPQHPVVKKKKKKTAEQKWFKRMKKRSVKIKEMIENQNKEIAAEQLYVDEQTDEWETRMERDKISRVAFQMLFENSWGEHKEEYNEIHKPRDKKELYYGQPHITYLKSEKKYAAVIRPEHNFALDITNATYLGHYQCQGAGYETPRQRFVDMLDGTRLRYMKEYSTGSICTYMTYRDQDKFRRVVFGTRGTRGPTHGNTEWKDQNALHVRNGTIHTSARFKNNEALVIRVLMDLPAFHQVFFTGHSLGGSMALALLRKLRNVLPECSGAIIFNAGLETATYKDLKLIRSEMNTHNYHITGDIVSGRSIFGPSHHQCNDNDNFKLPFKQKLTAHAMANFLPGKVDFSEERIFLRSEQRRIDAFCHRLCVAKLLFLNNRKQKYYEAALSDYKTKTITRPRKGLHLNIKNPSKLENLKRCVHELGQDYKEKQQIDELNTPLEQDLIYLRDVNDLYMCDIGILNMARPFDLLQKIPKACGTIVYGPKNLFGPKLVIGISTISPEEYQVELSDNSTLPISYNDINIWMRERQYKLLKLYPTVQKIHELPIFSPNDC